MAHHLAAAAWGAARAYLLGDGSTAGYQAFLLDCLSDGAEVVVSRDLHTSTLAALVMTGAPPGVRHAAPLATADQIVMRRHRHVPRRPCPTTLETTGDIMACEDIEQRLTDLRAEKRDVEESMDMLPPHKRDLVEANLNRIVADIAREEDRLADCLAAAPTTASLSTVGFVGTIEVETKGTARIWFGLTESKDTADWIKIGQVRAWFTMNLEAADRPFYLAELPVLMEAMRSDLHVTVAHGGAEAGFHKSDPNDSFVVEGVRAVRAPMRISP